MIAKVVNAPPPSRMSRAMMTPIIRPVCFFLTGVVAEVDVDCSGFCVGCSMAVLVEINGFEEEAVGVGDEIVVDIVGVGIGVGFGLGIGVDSGVGIGAGLLGVKLWFS